MNTKDRELSSSVTSTKMYEFYSRSLTEAPEYLRRAEFDRNYQFFYEPRMV